MTRRNSKVRQDTGLTESSRLVALLRQRASMQDMLTCEDMLQAADELARLRARVRRQQTMLRAQAEQIKLLQPDHARNPVPWED
jgi:hypothetical protein